MIIISRELRSYENPQIMPISSKIIPPSLTAEFQYVGEVGNPPMESIQSLSHWPLLSFF